MRKHGTLKFTLTYMNAILVETWEAFKLPSAITSQVKFKDANLLIISLPNKGTNQQAFLAATQTSKGWKEE